MAGMQAGAEAEGGSSNEGIPTPQYIDQFACGNAEMFGIANVPVDVAAQQMASYGLVLSEDQFTVRRGNIPEGLIEAIEGTTEGLKVVVPGYTRSGAVAGEMIGREDIKTYAVFENRDPVRTIQNRAVNNTNSIRKRGITTTFEAVLNNLNAIAPEGYSYTYDSNRVFDSRSKGSVTIDDLFDLLEPDTFVTQGFTTNGNLAADMGDGRFTISVFRLVCTAEDAEFE